MKDWYQRAQPGS